MYPLPDDFDGAMFLSQRLDSIAFAEYQVSLYFEGDTILQISGTYALKLDGEVKEKCSPGTDGVGPTYLPRLVGDIVCELLFDRSTGDLVLAFKKGGNLVVEGDAGPYEAYQILFDGREVVV
jgi:hypothetical protein